MQLATACKSQLVSTFFLTISKLGPVLSLVWESMTNFWRIISTIQKKAAILNFYQRNAVQ